MYACILTLIIGSCYIIPALTFYSQIFRYMVMTHDFTVIWHAALSFYRGYYNWSVQTFFGGSCILHQLVSSCIYKRLFQTSWSSCDWQSLLFWMSILDTFVHISYDFCGATHVLQLLIRIAWGYLGDI